MLTEDVLGKSSFERPDIPKKVYGMFGKNNRYVVDNVSKLLHDPYIHELHDFFELCSEHYEGFDDESIVQYQTLDSEYRVLLGRMFEYMKLTAQCFRPKIRSKFIDLNGDVGGLGRMVFELLEPIVEFFSSQLELKSWVHKVSMKYFFNSVLANFYVEISSVARNYLKGNEIGLLNAAYRTYLEDLSGRNPDLISGEISSYAQLDLGYVFNWEVLSRQNLSEIINRSFSELDGLEEEMKVESEGMLEEIMSLSDVVMLDEVIEISLEGGVKIEVYFPEMKCDFNFSFLTWIAAVRVNLSGGEFEKQSFSDERIAIDPKVVTNDKVIDLHLLRSNREISSINATAAPLNLMSDKAYLKFKYIVVKALHEFFMSREESNVPGVKELVAMLLDSDVEDVIQESKKAVIESVESGTDEKEQDVLGEKIERELKGKKGLRLPRGMKGSRVLKAFRKLVGEEERVSGSHHIFPGGFPIPVHGKKDVTFGIVMDGLKFYGLTPAEFMSKY